MANTTVKIYDYITREDGTRTSVPVDIELDTRSTAVTKGKFKVTWYEGTRRMYSKGFLPNIQLALKEARAQKSRLDAEKNGLTVHNPNAKDKTSIAIAAEAYLNRTKLNGRPGTVALATFDLEEFQQWNDRYPRRKYVEDITKDDMLEFRNWLTKTGRVPRTAVNKVMRINHFICQTLGLQPGKGPITQKEADKIVVRKAENDVEYYSQEELDKFFAACDEKQNLLFSTFLYSGCRREEIAFLYWDDLDLEAGTLHVTAKPEFDFTTKTKEERKIQLPDFLVARLKEAKKTAKHRLVFPTKNGGPLGNSLLVACKRIGKRAGLNCGTCQTCLEKNECEHVFLHKFRATCATRMAQAGVPPTDVQEHLGHSDLATTMRYFGVTKEKAHRAKVNAVWA